RRTDDRAREPRARSPGRMSAAEETGGAAERPTEAGTSAPAALGRTSPGRALLLLIMREARVAWDGGGGAAAPAAAFLSAAALMVFAVGSEHARLAAAGPGALAFSFALAALLGFEQLFQGDLEAGAIEPLALGPVPLELVA